MSSKKLKCVFCKDDYKIDKASSSKTGREIKKSGFCTMFCKNKSDFLLLQKFINTLQAIFDDRDSGIWQYGEFGDVPFTVISKLEGSPVSITDRLHLELKLSSISSEKSFLQLLNKLKEDHEPSKWAIKEFLPLLKNRPPEGAESELKEASDRAKYSMSLMDKILQKGSG